MNINILNDNCFSFSVITKSLTKNQIEFQEFSSLTEIESYISIHSVEPLLVPYSYIDCVERLSCKSFLVLVDTDSNSEKLLRSLRCGAVNFFSLDGSTGSIDSVIEHLRNLSERETHSTAISDHNLKASEHRFRIIAEHALQSEFWIDANNKLIYQSPVIAQMTGFPLENFFTDSPSFFLSLIHPHDLKDFLDKNEIFTKDLNHKPLIRQFRIITKTGEIRWWESITEHIFSDNGDYIGQRGTSRDISRQILSEQETDKIIAEKELLIKEVHHRVKNNLAIISGILNLQELYLHDSRDMFILDILKNRMQSMISVHELLYAEESTDTFCLEELARTIALNLIQETGLDHTEINIIYNINPVPVKSELASPIGLILNELITNCLKYAFNNQEKGRIFIGSTIMDEIRTLYIEDDGEGFPEEVLLGRKHNLGLVLVHSLADQLGGELFLNNSDGSQAVVVFPSN